MTQNKGRGIFQTIGVFLAIAFIAYIMLRFIKVFFMPDTSWLVFLIPFLVVLFIPAGIGAVNFIGFLANRKER